MSQNLQKYLSNNYSTTQNNNASSSNTKLRGNQQKTKLEKFIQNSTAPFSQKSLIASLSSTSKLYDERKKLMQQNKSDVRKSDAASKNRLESNNSVTRLSMPKEAKTIQPHQRQRSSNNFSKLNSIQSRSLINRKNSGNQRPKSGQFRKERSFTPVKSRQADNNYYNQDDQYENEEDATVVQVLQTKESVEMRTAYQSNPQSSSNKKQSIRSMIKVANDLEQQLSKSKYSQQKQEKANPQPYNHLRRQTLSSYPEVQSKIYQHFQQPKELSPVQKRDAMEQFIEPENLVGLKGIKNEIINKQQEKEELEMNIRNLQEQLKEVSKKYDGLDKGNILVHKEFKKLTSVNDQLSGNSKSLCFQLEEAKVQVKEEQSFLDFVKQHSLDYQSQIEQQKISIANLQQHVKEQKALIQLEIKQREEIRGQVLLQRKQIDVAKKKVDIQKQKYKDFKIGTNQSIMNMSAMISTTSKTSNNSKFLTQNRGFFQSNSNK